MTRCSIPGVTLSYVSHGWCTRACPVEHISLSLHSSFIETVKGGELDDARPRTDSDN